MEISELSHKGLAMPFAALSTVFAGAVHRLPLVAAGAERKRAAEPARRQGLTLATRRMGIS